MRLIDADALIQSLEKKHAHWHELVPEENKEIEYAHQYAVNVIRNAPSAEPTGDLIKREDAIKAVTIAALDDRDELEAIKALPSAEAEPTVIRSRTFMPTKDFKEWAKRIREVNPNAVVIPCDAEVVSAEAEPSLKAIKRQIDEHWYLDPPSAEAVQGEWGHMIADGSDGSHWYEYECSHCGEVVLLPYNFCPNCGAKMTKGGDNNEIDGAPTIDAVQVVRCKDCKYYDESLEVCRCSQWDLSRIEYPMVDADGFCSYGERRYK